MRGGEGSRGEENGEGRGQSAGEREESEEAPEKRQEREPKDDFFIKSGADEENESLRERQRADGIDSEEGAIDDVLEEEVLQLADDKEEASVHEAFGCHPGEIKGAEARGIPSDKMPSNEDEAKHPRHETGKLEALSLEELGDPAFDSERGGGRRVSPNDFQQENEREQEQKAM